MKKFTKVGLIIAIIYTCIFIVNGFINLSIASNISSKLSINMMPPGIMADTDMNEYNKTIDKIKVNAQDAYTNLNKYGLLLQGIGIIVVLVSITTIVVMIREKSSIKFVYIVLAIITLLYNPFITISVARNYADSCTNYKKIGCAVYFKGERR